MKYIQRSADHQYTFDGQTYPGVTGILKVIDKSDALMAWAARNTAEAAIDMAASGTQEASGLRVLLDAVGRDGAIKALTSRSSWKRDEAASLGTEVHRLADILASGGPAPVIPENAKGHVEHYRQWWSAAGWTLKASEAMVIHPGHGYGGTIDLLCKDRDGRTVLADIKTGKGVYSEAVLQLTAYGAAAFIETDAGIYTMPKVDRYVILHVTGASPVREVEVSVGSLEVLAWAGAMDLSAWHKTTKGKRL